MSTVQLADVYTPTAFSRRAQQKQIELNAFLASGVAASDPLLTTMLSGGSNIVELPQFNGVTIKEPNYSSDDPGSDATPEKISSALQKARSASRNQHWSAMDLVRDLSDADPVGAITNRIGAYWATDDEKRLIQSALGVLADNEANDSGDMVNDIATDDAGAVTDAERISPAAVIAATQTMGDHKTGLSVIAMHSVQHARLQTLGVIVDNFDPETGALRYQTYLGNRVVVDDSLPAVAGSNRITYTTILLGPGAFGFGTGKVQTPSALSRNELAGDGGGESIISSRVNTAFHPNGFAFSSASVAGQSPTYAELATAANWNRVVSRKAVNMAFLKVND